MKYWFGPKDSDFGVKSWQGWLSILILAAGVLFRLPSLVASYMAPLLQVPIAPARIALTIAWIGGFLLLVRFKYEPED